MKTHATGIVGASTSRLNQDRSFTLVELLAVVAMLILWALLLTPAFSGARPNGSSVECLNNQRQLTLAWTMYAVDNGGHLVVNGNEGVRGSYWVNGVLSWGLDSDNTNTLNLTKAMLGPYTRGAVEVYHCVADRVLSSTQQRAGWKARVRSISMNGFIEGGLYQDPSGGSYWFPSYRRYDYQWDIVQPAPSNLWVFAEEHPDSINDGWMIMDPTTSLYWVDIPGSFHNGAGVFGFADAHAELHKWQEPTTLVPVCFTFPHQLPTGNRRDVIWVQQHSTAPR